MMRAATLCVVAVLLLACFGAHAAAAPNAHRTQQHPDAVMHHLQRAFAALEQDDHDTAHRVFAATVPAFEATRLDGGDLEKALVSDPKKPYRGRQHERVLVHVVLAALDMERGRYDMALPSLKSAAFFDAKASTTDTSDAVVIDALLLHCLTALGARPNEIDDVKARVSPELQQRMLAPHAALVLRGRGPSFVRGGSGGEALVTVAGDPLAGSVVRIALAPTAADDRAAGTTICEATEPAMPVWSSTEQATSVRGRPFAAVLAERAALKRTARDASDVLIGTSLPFLAAPQNDADRWVGALSLFAGLFFCAVDAATDARVDVRAVNNLPEVAFIVDDACTGTTPGG